MKNRTKNDIAANFSASFKAWYEANWNGTFAELGKELGVSGSHVRNVIFGIRKSEEPWRRMVAEFIGIPYDEMIGIASKETDCVSQNDQAYEVSPKRKIVLDHYRVVEQFPDHRIAFEINKDLLHIANVDPEHFKDLANYIKHEANRMKIKGIPPKKPNGVKRPLG